MEEAKGWVKHVLLAKFKDGISESKIEELIKGYASLVNLIEPMKSFNWKLSSTQATTVLKCAIDHILKAQQKRGINENNIYHVVDNINADAIKNTLLSIEWGITELVNHPESQKKLREELDTVLRRGVQITEPDIQKLPYLQAVIKETLRLRMTIC